MATILGTLQSCLTDFRFLSGLWKKNCEEERLLGVSLTGIYDCKVLYNAKGSDELEKLKEIAVMTNELWAKKLGLTNLQQ